MSFVIDTSDSVRDEENVKVKFETLRAMEQAETIDIDSHMSDRVSLFVVEDVLFALMHFSLLVILIVVPIKHICAQYSVKYNPEFFIQQQDNSKPVL
jgi:hypothetical protein